MLKRTLGAAALAVVLAAPAFAQSPAKTDSSKPVLNTQTSMPHQNGAAGQTAGFMQNQDANEWRGSKLIGATVYGPDNKSIGEIEELILANDGSVKAAVVGVGGFLGVGEKNVALPFAALNISRKLDSNAIDKISVSYSKEQLKDAPTFAYYDASKSQTTGSAIGGSPATPLSPPATRK